MTQLRQPLSKGSIEVLAASAVVWLVRLLGVLTARGAERRRRSMRRFLKHIERAVECIVFLWAVERFGPVPRKRRRPGGAPAGFRRAKGNLRLLFKSAHIRARGADAFARIGRLLEVLARPTAYIARFMRRIVSGLVFFHLVASAPPAHACASLAHPEARFADSS